MHIFYWPFMFLFNIFFITYVTANNCVRSATWMTAPHFTSTFTLWWQIHTCELEISQWSKIVSKGTGIRFRFTANPLSLLQLQQPCVSIVRFPAAHWFVTLLQVCTHSHTYTFPRPLFSLHQWSLLFLTTTVSCIFYAPAFPAVFSNSSILHFSMYQQSLPFFQRAVF